MTSNDSIGLVLLAAGSASRMGEPKQLLIIDGKPMVRRAAEAALASRCRPVIIVVGAYQDRVRQALAGLPVTIAPNPDWAAGMGSSIHTGIRHLPDSASAAILALADQPLITGAIYDDLIRRTSETGLPIIASRYAGTAGVPVLFDRTYFSKLLELEPSQGCKGIIVANPADCFLLDCPAAEIDVDTPESYRQFLREPAPARG